VEQGTGASLPVRRAVVVTAPVGVAFRPLRRAGAELRWSLTTTAVSARHAQVEACLESARGIAHEQNWVCRSDGGELSEDWLSQADAPA
jgi:hypothetical protein